MRWIAITVAALVSALVWPPPAAAQPGRLAWPLRPRPEVTRAYDAPAPNWTPGHRGVDLAGKPGQRVLAAAGGTVVFAGELAGRPVVSIAHPGGLRTSYEPVRPTVRPGQRLDPEAMVGVLEAGHPGCPLSACLHWGAMWGPASRADYVDPLGLVVTTPVRLKPTFLYLRERAGLHTTRRGFSAICARSRGDEGALTVETMTTDAHRARRPRFGLTAGRPRTGEEMRVFARAVEAAGFDVLTFADHLVPLAPPFSSAAAAAMATARLRVGTLVLNNDFRHPVDTAREAAGIALVSSGRFELGIGAGHMKSEYDAAGIPFDDGGVRVSRLTEATVVIRALLDGEPVDVDGAHYRIHADGGQLVPPPPSRVPLLIGGNGTRVLRLAGQIADIVGLAGITHNRDATEVRLTHFGSEGLEDRIAVVREAAGGRFERIELNALIQAVIVTDEPHRAAEQLAATLGGASAADLLDSPFVLIGTTEQMAEQLTQRQQRFGVSYWTVFDELPGRASAMSAIAEVIRLLR